MPSLSSMPSRRKSRQYTFRWPDAPGAFAERGCVFSFGVERLSGLGIGVQTQALDAAVLDDQRHEHHDDDQGQQVQTLE